MKLKIALSVLLVVICSAQARAQDTDHDGLVTFLVPINVPRPTPGAYGTMWQSEIWIHNGLGSLIAFYPCTGGPCTAHPAGVTERAFFEETFSSIGPVVLFLASDNIAKISLSSRLFELSRHTQPAGVHMPIVREDRFLKQASRFVGISGSAANRAAIRVYDPRRRSGSQVRVEMIDSAGVRLAEAVLTLHYTDSVREPGYTAIYDLAAAFPQLAAVQRYDVRVTPLTPGMEYWALVSVTDVETQHVLLITSD